MALAKLTFFLSVAQSPEGGRLPYAGLFLAGTLWGGGGRRPGLLIAAALVVLLPGRVATPRTPRREGAVPDAGG